MTESFRDILTKELDQRVARNPRYSMRAYARDLSVSPSFLSEVLKGKWSPSRASARKICKGLQFGKHHTEYFCDLIDADNATNPARQKAAQKRLKAFNNKPELYDFPDDVFKSVADWYHLAIVSLLETKDHETSSEWIGHRLGIEAQVAQDAMDRLERLGILEYTDEGVKIVHNQTAVNDGVSPDAMRTFHSQILDKAKNAMLTQPREERHLRCRVMAVSKDALPELNQLVQEFGSKLSAINAKYGDKEEVYLAAVQLARLSVDVPERTPH